jgi:CRP/FNR family transcriptional regulator, dissimilatory nitrate respiration regulator
MKEYLNVLKSSELFCDMSDDDILKTLTCLNGKVNRYNKDETIYLAGDTISKIGIVLNGSILVTKDDIMGNRNILTNISESGLFGEAFVCSNISFIPVTVVACAKCEILFLDFKKIIQTCASNCSFHSTLIKNMLYIISNKNILLNNKIELLSAKSTRDKLMAYFNMQINKNKNGKFKIPFNRDALADFLNLNRSSMSRELSKMRDENIINFNKNEFEILI